MLMKTRTALIVCGSAVLVLAAATQVFGQNDDNTVYPYVPFDHKTISYLEPSGNDPVALLENRLQAGQAKLEYDPKWGYLPSVLKNLGINSDSQVLVFSKTSFQSPLISPAKPRALFFNDEVAVGSVQGGEVLELVSLDVKQGTQFYTLPVRKSEHPSFLRRTMECLNCHLSPGTLNVSGLLIASSYTGPDGSPAFRGTQDIIDHRS